MDIGGVGKGTASTIKHSKHVQDAETRITLQPTVPTPTRRAENVERSVIWQVRVDLLESLVRFPWLSQSTPMDIGVVGKGKSSKGGGKGSNAAKTGWNSGESGHMSSQCPKKKVHAVEESNTAS